MDMKTRTFQQLLVWDRLQDGLNKVSEANESLEKKAAQMFAGSTVLISVIAGSQLVPKTSADLSIPEAVSLCVLCLTVLVMGWFSASLWGPQPTSATTSPDVMYLYREYISKTEDEAYNNALIDEAKAFDHAMWVNKEKSKVLRKMFIVLQGQVVVLAVSILVEVFC
jgi:hypothetical protein